MGGFIRIYSSLRLIVTICLLIIFLWKFAYPSINKYLDAGVITEKSWRRREVSDSPAVTLCALNRDSGAGWKNTIFEWEELDKTSMELFCGNPNTIEEALSCFKNDTYSLDETLVLLNGTRVKGVDYIKKDNIYWIQDITDSRQGRECLNQPFFSSLRTIKSNMNLHSAHWYLINP